MRNALVAVTAFLMAFAVAMWLFFPYETFIENIMNTIGNNFNTDIKYSSVSSGIFSTDFTDVKAGEREIGDVSFSHSPLKLFSGQLGLTVTGVYNANATLSNNNVVFDINTVGKALDFIKEPVRLDGNVHITGTMDPINDTSEITSDTEQMFMKTPMGEMKFLNVTGEFESKHNNIEIKSFRSDDRMGLDMRGNILINNDFFTKSNINLDGSIKFMGVKKNLTIRGQVDNIHPELN